MKKATEFMSADRYLFDFGECSSNRGFVQIDTREDASYYGNWLNPTALIFVSYCEGDITRIHFDTPAECTEFIREMCEFHRRLGREGIKIDGMCRPNLITAVQSLGLGDLLH